MQRKGLGVKEFDSIAGLTACSEPGFVLAESGEAKASMELGFRVQVFRCIDSSVHWLACQCQVRTSERTGPCGDKPYKRLVDSSVNQH